MSTQQARCTLTAVVCSATLAIVVALHIVAEFEGIHDLRARQVSWLFVASALVAWLLMLRRASKHVLTAVYAASVGVWIAFDLCLLAWTPWVVVTPPIAWLVTTGASACGGILSMRVRER